ncbi:hypothetical protein O181_027663 [Austropuccinia psidii MF-1]|uniref:Uncharacterized protein n=1 Tax=Austropuccinia psidii MF-1 TaxID=1389203 RepID=A0A9Q3CS84_9BASI|nr:hypothetical protein [Austropuccinia psidii MF-1]
MAVDTPAAASVDINMLTQEQLAKENPDSSPAIGLSIAATNKAVKITFTNAIADLKMKAYPFDCVRSEINWPANAARIFPPDKSKGVMVIIRAIGLLNSCNFWNDVGVIQALLKLKIQP